MATDAETDQQVDSGQLWRALGRLESDVASLHQGQTQLRDEQRETRAEMAEGQRETRAEMAEGQQETRAEMAEGQRETNRRIDRVFYTIIAIGGALIVAVIASRFIGG